jgi:hypothetical protein
MPDATLHLRPLAAADALHRALNIGRTIFPKSTVSLVLSTDINGLSLTVSNIALDDRWLERPEVAKLISLASAATGNAPVMCTSFRITEGGHGGHNPMPYINYGAQLELLTAQITLEGFAYPERIITTRDAVVAEFKTVPKSSLVSEAIAEPQRSALKHQESVIAELQSLVGKLTVAGTQQISRYDEYFVKFAERHDASRRELEIEYQAKQSLLTEEHRARVAELDQLQRGFVAAHAKAEQELEVRKKEVESRDNTFVRRDLHEKLNAIVAAQKDAKLSAGTVGKRTPIHWACGIAAATGLGLNDRP